MEFTIPANQITNKLKLIGVYVIDVLKLYENSNKTFDEFKALLSFGLLVYFGILNSFIYVLNICFECIINVCHLIIYYIIII